MVRLDDGTYGVLPEEWLRRIGPLAGMGKPEQGHVRFRHSQAGLLDALVAAQPEARCDETFARVREELRRFHSVEPAAQPAGFVGQLRDYQSEGLGWMHFLQRFSFGGCLADDMGVGKTAQVLALLESRRELRAAGEPVGPSLVVVPKSLVFNWKEEAARFTPQLRVLDHTGLERNGNDFAAYDLVLTTYGTLRRDAWSFKDAEFEAPGVSAQRAVGGEHQVVSGEVIAVALQPGMIEHPQLRSEACRFLLPVEYERLRNNHQGRTDGLACGAQLAAGFEQRQYLRGLAHTHVVR